MRDLDLDACLAQNPDEEPFTVVLKDDELFPDGAPSLDIKIKYVEFRKVFAKFYKTKMMPGKREQKGVELEMSGNDYEFGLRMADYIVGWWGISGAFDRGKLKTFFERFPTVCEAFGNNIAGVFKAKDGHYLKYRETIEKN